LRVFCSTLSGFKTLKGFVLPHLPAGRAGRRGNSENLSPGPRQSHWGIFRLRKRKTFYSGPPDFYGLNKLKIIFF
jgi:hypothetical protein